MRVRPELSQATSEVMQLVTAIVGYSRGPEEVLEIAGLLWPRLCVHHGHTHIRLMLLGKHGYNSIYVELG